MCCTPLRTEPSERRREADVSRRAEPVAAAILPTVENLTHSLLGATLAELALPSGATTPQRRIFFTTGIIAANLPDADLLYSRIMPSPLGYLLHHRGHTHTLAGLIPLALLIGAASLLPHLSLHVARHRTRLWTLIAVGLLSHLVLDSWNSYGVHPFWPIDARWYYGDVIYIFEPWLWLLLGVAATRNTQNLRTRMILGGTLALLAGALALSGMIPIGALLALVVGGAALAAIVRAWTPRASAGFALGLMALFVAAMFGLRREVHARALASLSSTARGTVLDVVLSAQPANPLCWQAVAITSDERAGEYVMTRGSLAAIAPLGCGFGNDTWVRWDDSTRRPLVQLRELTRRDCWARAWMQFGRAPDISGGAIGDLRFGGATPDNFTTMRLKPGDQASVCPRNMTRWGMPRADLLQAAAAAP